MRKPVTDIQRDIGNRLFLKGILLQLAGGGEELLRRHALRMADDIADIAAFSDAAVGEDDDAVSDLWEQCEVVRNEETGHLLVCYEPAQQCDDVLLYGHVERARRLITDEQGR